MAAALVAVALFVLAGGHATAAPRESLIDINKAYLIGGKLAVEFECGNIESDAALSDNFHGFSWTVTPLTKTRLPGYGREYYPLASGSVSQGQRDLLWKRCANHRGRFLVEQDMYSPGSGERPGPMTSRDDRSIYVKPSYERPNEYEALARIERRMLRYMRHAKRLRVLIKEWGVDRSLRHEKVRIIPVTRRPPIECDWRMKRGPLMTNSGAESDVGSVLIVDPLGYSIKTDACQLRLWPAYLSTSGAMLLNYLQPVSATIEWRLNGQTIKSYDMQTMQHDARGVPGIPTESLIAASEVVTPALPVGKRSTIELIARGDNGTVAHWQVLVKPRYIRRLP